MNGTATSRQIWTSRYEDLRSQVMGGRRPDRGGWGLALFIRQGMIAWMRAWPKRSSADVSKGHCPPESVARAVQIPLSVRKQVTMVLATMILNGRREVRA